jgi:hypothetical protein
MRTRRRPPAIHDVPRVFSAAPVCAAVGDA